MMKKDDEEDEGEDKQEKEGGGVNAGHFISQITMTTWLQVGAMETTG